MKLISRSLGKLPVTAVNLDRLLATGWLALQYKDLPPYRCPITSARL